MAKKKRKLGKRKTLIKHEGLLGIAAVAASSFQKHLPSEQLRRWLETVDGDDLVLGITGFETPSTGKHFSQELRRFSWSHSRGTRILSGGVNIGSDSGLAARAMRRQRAHLDPVTFIAPILHMRDSKEFAEMNFMTRLVEMNFVNFGHRLRTKVSIRGSRSFQCCLDGKLDSPESGPIAGFWKNFGEFIPTRCCSS